MPSKQASISMWMITISICTQMDFVYTERSSPGRIATSSPDARISVIEGKTKLTLDVQGTPNTKNHESIGPAVDSQSGTIAGLEEESHDQNSTIAGLEEESHDQNSTIAGLKEESHDQKGSIAGLKEESHDQNSTVTAALLELTETPEANWTTTKENVSTTVIGNEANTLDDASNAHENNQHQSTITTTITTVVWPSDQEIKEQQRLICSLGCDCPPEGQTDEFLDCSGRKIKELPNGIVFSPHITGVNFQKNNLSNISSYTFIDGLAIELLDLGENRIQVIEDDSFQSFKSLNKLRLSNNRLRSLPKGLLTGVEDLRVLEIGHNEISEIPISLFSPAKNLQEVRLQFNKLEVLDQRIFEFLPKLEKLDLGGNGLKSLHPNLFHFTPRLNWLSLLDNRFEEVPREALSKPKKLNSLDLSGNRFQTLRKGSFSMVDSVTTLYLNNIPTLIRIEEFAFANMTNLKSLYCSYNRRLHYIHPNAFGCPDQHPSYRSPPIDHLYLRQNALKRLPEPTHVSTWSRLSYADFRENPWICDCNLRWMKKIPQEIFSSVKCESPLNMHGRSFDSLEEAELQCNDPWMLSTIILGLTSALVFAVCMAFVVAMVYSRSSIRHYIRSRSQFMYSKVPPRTENVDLEWDPSADL